MAQLRQDYPKFEQRNTQVVVVGPDSARAFASFWREHELPFIGLPDPKASVLGLYAQEVNLLKFGRMPAQLIIDREGMVRYVHYGRDMTDIPSNSEVLALLEEINKPPG